MSILDQLLARLQQQSQRTRDFQLVGPAEAVADRLPQPLQGLWRASQYLPLGMAPDALDLTLDASGEVAKALTGLGVQAAAALPWGNQEFKDAAAGAGDGDPFERLRRTNENIAATHPYLSGIANLLLDPTNLATPAAEAAGLVSKAPRLATPARTLAERADDALGGARAVKGALSIAWDQGKQAQALAQAGGQLVSQGLYKRGPKAGQARSPRWHELRLKLNPGTAWSNWKQQMVLTPRNLLQDLATGHLWAREAGIPAEEVNHAVESMVANATGGGLHPKDVLPSRMSQLLQDFGWRPTFDTQRELGMGFLDANAGEADKFLSPWVSAALEAGYAAANPLRGGIPVAGVGLAGAKGYYRAYQNAAFSALSHLIQGGFRSVAWEVGFGDELARRSQAVKDRGK